VCRIRDDQTQVGYSVARRSGGQVTSCAIIIVFGRVSTGLRQKPYLRSSQEAGLWLGKPGYDRVSRVTVG
jgi:hypothetical protein